MHMNHQRTSDWLRSSPTAHLIILLAELAPLSEQRLDGAAEAVASLRAELRCREWSTETYKSRSRA